MPRKKRVQLTLQGKKQKLRQREKRLTMTPEERRAARKRDRDRKRKRRAEMTQEELEMSRRQQALDKRKQRRKLERKCNETDQGAVEVIEGEAKWERIEQLYNERTLERRRKCPKTLEQKCKLALKKRVDYWVQRALRITEEVELEVKVKRRNCGIENIEMEETAEEEDNRCFKQYLSLRIKIEWDNVYCELRGRAMFLEGLWDPTKPPPSGTARIPAIPSISESLPTPPSKLLKFGPDPPSRSSSSGCRGDNDKESDAEWTIFLSDESASTDTDEKSNYPNRNDNTSFMDNFVHLQMEDGITQDNFYDESSYRLQPSEIVDDWISRVNNFDAEASTSYSNSEATCTIKTRSRKSKLVPKTEIKYELKCPPDEKPRSPIRRAEPRESKKYYSSSHKMRDKKLKELKKLCHEARKRWISERPEEDSLRACTDKARVKLTQKIYSEKAERGRKIRAELLQKQAELAMITEEERTQRINMSMESARKFLVLNDHGIVNWS